MATDEVADLLLPLSNRPALPPIPRAILGKNLPAPGLSHVREIRVSGLAGEHLAEAIRKERIESPLRLPISLL